VLTTHYLEEAETLCNRIAMLKQGKLLALEDKDALMSHGSARRLLIKTRAHGLPATLVPLITRQNDGDFELKLADCDQLESILAELRQAGIGLKDIEISKPDLEEIFVDMMNR